MAQRSELTMKDIITILTLRFDYAWTVNNQMKSASKYVDGIDSSDPWRTKEVRYYRPGQIGNLFYKDVYYYPSASSDEDATSRTFHYGYDAVGNVILVTEEYCGGSAFSYYFAQAGLEELAPGKPCHPISFSNRKVSLGCFENLGA